MAASCLSSSASLEEKDKETFPALQRQPFPFFQLPDDLVIKILKEYVPVTDKERVLRHVQPFTPYLEMSSVWFPSTHRLFQLAETLPAGWYVNMNCLHERYYSKVDYVHLNLVFHMYCTQKLNHPKCIRIQDNPTSFTEMTDILTNLHTSLELTPVTEDEILSFNYRDTEIYVNIWIWIFPFKNVVRWSEDDREYALKGNRCTLMNQFDTFSLLYKEDRTIHMTCELRHDWYSKACFQCDDVRLHPVYFDVQPTEPKHQSVHQTTVFEHRTEGNTLRVVYPRRVMSFTNVHRADASVETRDFHIRPRRPFFPWHRRDVPYLCKVRRRLFY